MEGGISGKAKWVNSQIKQGLYYKVQNPLNSKFSATIAIPASSSGVGAAVGTSILNADTKALGALGLLLPLTGSEAEHVKEQRNILYAAISDQDVAALSIGIFATNPYTTISDSGVL